MATPWQPGGLGVAARYEYRVRQLRESLVGGEPSADQLEKLSNDEAADGWPLKAITGTAVRGRVGPGVVDGLLVTLERPTN